MKSRDMSIIGPALLLAVCGAAFAAPLETLTLPPASDPAPLISDGINGDAANRVITITPTTGGTVKSLKLNGVLNSIAAFTYGQEAQIQITPPGGSPVIVQAFPDEFTFTSLTMTDYTIAVADVVGNSGAWEIRFFESFDDGGEDAQWEDGLTIVLDSEPVTITAPTATELGALPVGPFTLSDQVIDAGAVKWYKFTTPAVSAAAGTFLDIDTEFNPGQDTEIGLYKADGTLVANDDDSGTAFLSQLTFGAGTRCPVSTGFPYDGFNGDLEAGEYYLAVVYYNATFARNFVVTTNDVDGGTLQINFNSGTQPASLPTPVANLALGNIATTPAYATTFTASVPPAGIYWVSFTVPGGIDAASRLFLDIDTEGTVGINTALIAFDATTGAYLGGDAGGGSLANSNLSWGSGYRPPIGDGFPYDGFMGDINAGDSLLIGVLTTPVGFVDDGFFVCTAGTGGDITVNVRAGVQPAATPPPFDDLGAISDTTPNVGRTAVTVEANQTKWYKFNLTRDVSSPDFYLDIDTEGSLLAPSNDTMIFLYNDAGDIFNGGPGQAFDDDSGSGLLSQLSFGNAAPRPPVGDGATYANQDGQITAGVYYLAVTGYPANAYINEWAVFSASNNVGTINLTIATSAGTPGVNCLADINGDSVVDGTDYTLFINSFGVGDVNLDSNADVSGGIPSGGDGIIDGNDYIAFINAFSAGC